MKISTRLTIALACVVALVLAVAPWTVSSRALTASVSEQLLREYGLGFAANGRTTIAFLPVPRVKFEDIAVVDAAGHPVLTGGQLRGELALLPLLAGQISVTEISLLGTRIDVRVGADGASPWDTTLRVLDGRLGESRTAHTIRRLVVNSSDLAYGNERTGSTALLRDVNLIVNWEDARAPVEIGGAFVWRGELIQVALSEFHPAAVRRGLRAPVELRATSRLARLTLVGTAANGADGPWFTGRSILETRSMADLAVWSGLPMPLAPLVGAATLEGEARAVGHIVSWPAVRITLDGEALDGALSVRYEGGRLAVNGTLDAPSLDLTRFAAPFADATTADGFWNTRRLDLAEITSADLDLRLSASAARLGSVETADLALSVLVKPGRVEASLGRASLNGGLIKGRLSLASVPEGIEFKAQAASQRIDAAALLADLGAAPWISGDTNAQLYLEGTGASAAELAGRVSGKVSLAVRQGELVGLGLDEALRRFERRPLSASLNLRSGRTLFDEAQATLALANGFGEFVDAGFSSSALRGVMRGRVFVADRMVAAKVAVEAKAAPKGSDLVPALVFDLVGPWANVAVIPDAKALIQRSGAARLLLDPAASLGAQLPQPVPSLAE